MRKLRKNKENKEQKEKRLYIKGLKNFMPEFFKPITLNSDFDFSSSSVYSLYVMPTNPRVKYHRLTDGEGYVDAQVKTPLFLKFMRI